VTIADGSGNAARYDLRHAEIAREAHRSLHV
jgi:hypothetical protein